MKSSTFALFIASACASAATAQTPEIGKSASALTPVIAAAPSPAKPKAASPQTWVNLGNSLMQQARNTVGQDFAPASAAFSKALSIQPDNLDAIVGMAWVKNSEHNFTAGRQWSEKALAMDPHQVDAHSLIGDGAVELGNYDEAFDQYQVALQSRSDLSTLSRAGHLLWLTGDITRGRALMQQAIKAGGPHPENAAWCQAELAIMNFQSGAIPPAEALATQALAAAPENPRILATLARIHAAKKDYPKAIELYEKSASITPNHEAMAALVDLYHLTGQEQKSQDQSDRLISFHRQYPHPNSALLARFYADHDRELETALKEARTAYEVYKNVNVADTLAWCLLKSGQPEEARRMIRQAMKWKTPDSEMQFHAGMIEVALKHPEAARRCFNQALSMNPDFHPIDAATAGKMLEE